MLCPYDVLSESKSYECKNFYATSLLIEKIEQGNEAY